MCEDCVPYRRKSLYLLLTVPMIGIYVAVGALLWRLSTVFFVVYVALFVTVAVAQAYVCAYWACPYVGRFGPCVGGFCLPSSQIARLLKNVRRSERIYNVALSVAMVAFVGIIVFPVYFLYGQGVRYLLAYVGIVVAYAAGFLWWICPACATRHVCPGGQFSTRLKGGRKSGV